MSFRSPKQSSAPFHNWNYPLIIQVWLFCLYIFGFQLIWELFESEINSFSFLNVISQGIGSVLLKITPLIVNALFGLQIQREDISLILPNGYYVSYWFYLSGIKQMTLVTFLYLLIQGPWLKKLWYLPLNILIILLLVFFRFITLTIHCTVYPEHIHLLQDLLFGPLFYIEILIMWLAWVLLIARSAPLKIKHV